MFRLEKVHELGFHWEQRQDRRTEHNGLSEKTEENLDTPPACSSPLPSLLLLLCRLLSSLLCSSPLRSTLLSSLLSICLWTHCYGNDTQGSLGGDRGDRSDDFRQISSFAHTFSGNPNASVFLFVLVYTPLFPVLMLVMSKEKKEKKRKNHKCHKNVLNQPEKQPNRHNFHTMPRNIILCGLCHFWLN